MRTLVLSLLVMATACVGGAANDRDLAEKVAAGLTRACPLAPADDETARNECAAALTDFSLLRDSMANPFLWGGQQEQDGGVQDGWDLGSHVTRFEPRVWRRLYLSLYSFPGEHRVEQLSDGRTLLRLKPKFRNQLDMGAYPYPFWHRISKWESYQLAEELVFIIKDKKILGASRSFAARTDRAGLVAHEWGGQ